MPLPMFVEQTVIDPATKQQVKKTYLNPAKDYVKPFWLQTDPPVVSLLGNGTSAPIPMIVDNTGHLDIAYALYESDGPFMVNIFDPGRQGFLMNKPIHIDTIAGNAQRPFVFPESYFLNVSGGTRQLNVTFSDLSGYPNNIRFSLHGRKFLQADTPLPIYQRFQKLFQDKERTNLFFLTTEDAITALAAGATQKTEFHIPSDSAFEVLKFMAVGRRQGLISATTISFTGAAPDTINDAGANFLAAGFKAGGRIRVKSTSGLNDGYYIIAGVAAGVLTLVTINGLTNELAAAAGTVVITQDPEDIDFEVELQEYATGRYLHSRSSVTGISDAIWGRNVFGNAQFPFISYESYKLPRDYRLKVDLKNLHGTVAGNFYLTLVGRRLRGF